MCYPSCKKYRRTCFGKIKRIELKSAVMKIISYMVKRHDDHDKPTEQIDGGYALFW